MDEKQKGFCPFQFRIVEEDVIDENRKTAKGTMIKNKQCNEQCALYTKVGCVFQSISMNLGNLARQK